MVDPNHPRISIVRQCRLVSVARSSFSDAGTGESPLTLRLMRLIDEQFLETPFDGSRQMTRWFRRQGDMVSRKRVRRLMRLLGVPALYPRSRTSQPHPAHRIYPSLLRDLPITRPNHVWCTADVTDIPLRRGFLYLVVVMDWASRTGLSWRLSNTLDARVCVEALHEALERDGPPEIFNSDQGSQFTSVDFTDVLTAAGIRISMDGTGRWMDNVFIERLWRSRKDEGVYLSEFATGSQARTGIGGWMDFYDRCRPHSSLNDRTPAEVYTNGGGPEPGAMPRLPAAQGRLNHAPGFHLSCDEHLSKGWGPPLSLKTTNGLESVNALVEERCAKVDHWQNSSQRHRWLATALLDIEPRLRKVMGYRHLPTLRAALMRELKIDTTTSKKKAA